MNPTSTGEYCRFPVPVYGISLLPPHKPTMCSFVCTKTGFHVKMPSTTERAIQFFAVIHIEKINSTNFRFGFSEHFESDQSYSVLLYSRIFGS